MTYLYPKHEIELLDKGYTRVIGIDEVGRGCWAGPVAVGAFVFEKNHTPVNKVNDSKKLSLKNRVEVHALLSESSYKVYYGEAEDIDNFGISNTIEGLINKAVSDFGDDQTFFLIDGQFSSDFGSNSKKVVKGDSTYYSIAAASILAKVERDNLLNDLGKKFPEYGFEFHKGYGTKKHMEALEKFGICEIHRNSYKPILKYLA